MAIVLPILTTFNPAGIKAAQAGLAGMGGALGRLGLQGAAAAIALKTFNASLQFINESVDKAKDLERNMSALGTVFGSLTPQMASFTKAAAEMGLSQVDAARTSTFLGSVLKQAGLPMQEVADRTKDLTVLAQDLATTYGYDTSEALTAMTALFRGEYDPIEKFGVALKQNEVNALVAAKGLGHLTGQAMLNAQQQVRMEQLFLRSADAQGAFARQSGTLFVEQKKLNAAFENMQSTVGLKLTPALATVMQSMTPLVNDLTPRLNTSFGFIGTTIRNLTPSIDGLATIFGSVLDVINTLVGALEPLGRNLAAVINVAISNLGDVAKRAAYWVSELTNGVIDLGKSFDEVEPGPITSWLESIGNRLGQFNGLYQIAVKFKEQIIATNDALAFSEGAAMGTAPRNWARERNALIKRGLFNKDDGTDPYGDQGGGKEARNSVKEFFANLKDEMKKQAAKLKLAKLGASEAFIDSVVGSGADWQKVFKKITAGGTAMVAKLQKQFNKTAAGLNEIKQAAEDAKAKADELDAAAEELRQLKQDFAKSIRAGFSSLLAKEAPALGKFQQAVVDAFTGIKQTIMDADNKILSKKKKAIFLGLAEFAQQQLENIAKQRDALAAKIESAKSFMDSVKDSIFGQVNLADMGKTSSAIIANFKRIVQRSIEFRKNIAALSQAGLNSTALQQIIAGGAEAGGSAAKALLKGGSGAISQVNDLFGQLEEVASGVSETAGQALFGAGVDASNGLINGLLAQESELQKAAETLADSFRNAFDKRLGLSKPEFSPIGVSGSTQAGTTVNLTVNAPMGTGSNIGRLIIDEISRYERTSGLVFARA